MKKIFSSLVLLLALNAQAAYLNGLAATVNNEPITDYDVELVIKRMGVSPSDALNILIRDKLEDAQIKELGIVAPESAIMAELTQIAQQNGFSDFSSFASVSKPANLEELRSQIKQRIEKQMLYDGIMNQPNDNITRENALRFYEQNQGIFTTFSSAKVTKYSSSSGSALERVRNGSLISGVTSTNETLYPQTTEPRVLNLIAATSEGGYSPIINEGGSYAMYFVRKKEDAKVASFEEIEGSVATMMVEQEREAVLADYFNKLRVKANVEIIKR